MVGPKAKHKFPYNASLAEASRYLFNALLHPKHAQMGFLAEGFGYDKRYAHNKAQWSEHINRCKTEQERWLVENFSSTDNASLAVLGAGELADLNLSELARISSKLHLLDANPLCLRSWKNAKKLYSNLHFTFEISDLTGVLATWKWALDKHAAQSRNLEEVLDFLKDIHHLFPLSKDGPLWHKQFDGVLSLNLASQLPLGWQRIIENSLKKRFGASCIDECEDTWVGAYLPSARLILKTHLETLDRIAAKAILLITDVCFIQYQMHHEPNPPPTTSAHCTITESITKPLQPEIVFSESIKTVTQIDALCGYYTRGLDELLAGIKSLPLKHQYFWTWPIVPWGQERSLEGKTNLVGAFHFA